MKKARKDLIIVGASGLGREILWLARETGEHRILGWLDDAQATQGQSICELPVLGRVEDWARHGDAEFIVAIGAPRVRRQVVEKMRGGGVAPAFARIVHPSVRRSDYVELGEGTVVAAGCMLTTQVTLGRHCVIDRGAHVAHDCVVGDFCTVSPLAPLGGNVTLEDGVWVGAHACLRQGIRMGTGSMAGIGAVVVKDVAPNHVVAGSPARRLKTLPNW